MKRQNGILLVMALLTLLAMAGIVFAQEMTEEKDKEADTHHRIMARGRGRMMGRPGMMNTEHAPMMRRGRTAGRMDMITRLAGKLDLSEEQRDELNDISNLYKKSVIRKNADLQIAKVDLHELMRQEEPDLDAIEDQVRDIANLEAGTKFSQIKVRIDARNVLTEEQRAKLKDLMKDRKTRPTSRRRGQRSKPGQRRGRPMERRG